jgi:hypothetical protein
MSDVEMLRDELYRRLDDARRSSAVKVEPDDEFNLGINCRLANEEMWLLDLLHKLEMSY